MVKNIYFTSEIVFYHIKGECWRIYLNWLEEKNWKNTTKLKKDKNWKQRRIEQEKTPKLENPTFEHLSLFVENGILPVQDKKYYTV